MLKNIKCKNYTYDANGNLLTDDFKGISNTVYRRGSYAYSITKGSDQIDYLYDAGDLRFYKKVQTTAQTTEESTIRYVMGNQDKFLYGLVKKFLEITIVLNLQVKFIFSNLNKIKFMAVKRLMILVVPVMFSNTFFAQNTKLDSLKQKLQTDTAAFEQFVFLGKCNCIDEVIRFNNGISKKQEKLVPK